MPLRWLFNALIGFVVLCAAVVFGLQTEFGRKILTSEVLKLVNTQINGTLVCDDVRIDIFRGIVLSHPKLWVDGTAVLDAEELQISYDIAALVGHTTAVNQVLLSKPVINLVRDTNGVWNFSRIAKASASTDTTPSALVLRLRSFKIVDGIVNVNDRTHPNADAGTFDPTHLALQDVQLELSTLIDLTKREYTAVIDKLSFTDKRAKLLDVKRAALAVHLGPGGIQLRALHIETPLSSLTLQAQLLGVDIERDGLSPDVLRNHPVTAQIEMARLAGEDITFFLPFLDVRDQYTLRGLASYSGERLVVTDMDLRTTQSHLKGNVDISGLDGSTNLYLDVRLRDSRAVYAEVQRKLEFLHLPVLPFLGTTYMKQIEMRGHPSDSLWFDIDGRDDMGEVDGSMTLYLSTSPMAYRLDADIQHGDLSRIVADFAKCDLSGHVRLQGRGFTLHELTGSCELDLSPSTIASRAIRSGRFVCSTTNVGIVDVDSLFFDVTPFRADQELAQFDDVQKQTFLLSGTINGQFEKVKYDLHSEMEGLNIGRLFDDPALPTGFSGAIDVSAEGLSLDDFAGEIHAQVSEFSLNDRALVPFDIHLKSSIDDTGRAITVSAPFARIAVTGAYTPTSLIAGIGSAVSVIGTTIERRVQPFTSPAATPLNYSPVTFTPVDALIDLEIIDASPFNVFLSSSTLSLSSSVKARIQADSTKLVIKADDMRIRDLLLRSDSTTIETDPVTLRGELRYRITENIPIAELIDITTSGEQQVFFGRNVISKPTIRLNGTDTSLYSSISMSLNGIDGMVGVRSIYRNGQVTLLVDTIATTIDAQRKLEWTSLEDAKIHVRDQIFDVSGLVFRRTDGETVRIDGICSLDRFSNLHVQVSDFALPDIMRFVELEQGHPISFLDGIVRDLDVYLNGSWENPSMSMRMKADDVGYNKELIGSLSASVRYANRDIVGKLAIANAKANNTQNTLSIDVRHLPLDLGLRSVERRIVEGGVIDIDMRATQLSMAAIEPFLPAVERVSGIADGLVTMRGTLPSNMELGGSATFKNASFLASPTNIVYRAEGSLHLEGSKLHLDTIRIRNLDRDRRGGAAVANGIVTFDGLSVSRVDFNVMSKGILIMNKGSQVRNPKVFGDIVVASGAQKPIMFYGPLDAPVLSGDVDVLYADVVFPQDRASAKAKYSAFVYQRSNNRNPNAQSVLDTSTVIRVSDTSSSADKAAAQEIVADVIKSTTASFSDILRFNLNIYLRGRTLMTMVFGFFEILIADLEPVDVNKPLTITGRFLDNSTNMSGKVRVKEGTSTYKFYKPFAASGTLDFTQGGLGNPTLDLKAVFNGRRMSVQNNEPETYNVHIDITGTKKSPIARWSYYRNQRKQEGDSAKITGDALMLLLLGRTQDELTSTGQGSLVNEVNASLSAVATSALGDLLSGVGGLVQSVQMDLGADMSQTQLTVSGQLWSDVVYRLTGQVSDFAGNSTITVTVPFTVLKNADAMRYFNLDISRSVNNTGNITRFQRLWEIKLGARLP